MGDVTLQQLIVFGLIVMAIANAVVEVLKKKPDRTNAPPQDDEPEIFDLPPEDVDIPERVVVRKAPERMPERIPERIAERMPERMPERVWPSAALGPKPQPAFVPTPVKRAAVRPPPAAPATSTRPRVRRARVNRVMALRGMVLMMVLGPCLAAQQSPGADSGRS